MSHVGAGAMAVEAARTAPWRNPRADANRKMRTCPEKSIREPFMSKMHIVHVSICF